MAELQVGGPPVCPAKLTFTIEMIEDMGNYAHELALPLSTLGTEEYINNRIHVSGNKLIFVRPSPFLDGLAELKDRGGGDCHIFCQDFGMIVSDTSFTVGFSIAYPNCKNEEFTAKLDRYGDMPGAEWVKELPESPAAWSPASYVHHLESPAVWSRASYVHHPPPAPKVQNMHHQLPVTRLHLVPPGALLSAEASFAHATVLAPPRFATASCPSAIFQTQLNLGGHLGGDSARAGGNSALDVIAWKVDAQAMAIREQEAETTKSV